MFGTLFIKECKQVLKSLAYYLYLIILIFFMTTQMGENEIVEKPKPEQESYGTKQSDDKQMIMEVTLANLVKQIERESFDTYPMAFYKEVIPSAKEIEELKQIVERCSGKTWDKIVEERTRHYSQYDTTNYEQAMTADATYKIETEEGFTYEEFSQEMKKVCAIIGNGSDFEKDKFEQGVSVASTYEEALEEYQAICDEDRLTGAYMRLFCDYAGIMLALLPVFLGVTRCLRDKRSKAEEVIYARSGLSVSIVLSRYLANVFMIFVPVVLLAFIMQSSYLYQAKTIGITPDYSAFFTYSVIWLLPMILVVLGLSFLLTELINGIAAVIIQMFWAFADILSMVTLVGGFKRHLVVRWNVFGDTMNYLSQRRELYMNRGMYTLLSITFVVLTIIVYERKRKGGAGLNGKLFKDRH